VLELPALSRMADVRRALLVLVAGVLAVGCAGDPAYYQGVLDELPVPPGWEQVREVIRAPGAEISCTPIVTEPCPRVLRYYLVDGQPADAYPAVKQMLAAAGFAIDEEFDPTCDAPNLSACVVVASRAEDQLRVNLFYPGADPEGLGLPDDGRTLIRMQAARKIGGN